MGGVPLEEADLTLPPDARSGVTGGTEVWEMAQVAWDVYHESYIEFEARPREQQAWATAVWRARNLIETVKVKRMHDRVNR